MSKLFDYLWIDYDEEDDLSPESDIIVPGKSVHMAIPYLAVANLIIWIAIIKYYPISIWTVIILSMLFGSCINIALIVWEYFHKHKVLRELVVSLLTLIIAVGLMYARYRYVMDGIDLILFK